MTKTLDEARLEVFAGRDDGITCPCCDQLVKVYTRSINAGMAWVLIRLTAIEEKHRDGRWTHVLDEIERQKHTFKSREAEHAAAGDFGKLAYWGLIEKLRGKHPNGSSRIGFWRVTEAGIEFANNHTTVPFQKFIHNKQVLGPVPGTPLIDIHHAIKHHFSYDEVWG